MEKIEQLVLLSNLTKKYLGMDLENPTNYYDFKRQEELKDMCTVTMSLERLMSIFKGRTIDFYKDNDENCILTLKDEYHIADFGKLAIGDYDYDNKNFNPKKLKVTISLNDYFKGELKNSQLGSIKINKEFAKVISTNIPTFFDIDKIIDKIFEMLNSIIDEKKEVYEDLKKQNVYIAHDIRSFQGRDPEDYYSIFVGTPEERKKNKFKIYGHVEEKVITPSNLGEYCGDSKFFSDSQELKKLEAIEKENEDKEKDFNEEKESYMDLVNSLYWEELDNQPSYYYGDDYERHEANNCSYLEYTFDDIENFLDGKGDIDITELNRRLDSTIRNITREMSLNIPTYYTYGDSMIDSCFVYQYYRSILKLARKLKEKLNFFRNIKKGIYNKKDVDLAKIEQLRDQLDHDSYTHVSPEYCRELILLHKANIEEANKELQDVMKQVRFIRGIYLLLVSGIDLSKVNLDLFTEGMSLLEDVPEYEKTLKKEAE